MTDRMIIIEGKNYKDVIRFLDADDPHYSVDYVDWTTNKVYCYVAGNWESA